MDALGPFVLALALAGGAGLVIEILAKDPGALLSILDDAERFALDPAPLVPPEAPRLRLELAGAAATVFVATTLGASLLGSLQGPDTLATARDYHSRILAGTSNGVR
jgi:hypothetical protein